MKHITVIIGLPGSGKTCLAKIMADETTYVVDDLSVNPELIKTFPDILQPKIIFTDPKLIYVTLAQVEKKLTEWFGNHTTKIISFENDLQTCMKNVKNRNDGREISLQFIDMLSYVYENSEWPKDFPCWKP